MHRTGSVLLVLAMVQALAPVGAQAASASATCQAGKLGISARYASCRLKADSKSARSGAPADYSRCSLDKFTGAEAKAGVGICLTEGDQTTVKDHLDDCAARAALWLSGGGGLPNSCASDLVACSNDLAACEAQPPGKTQRTGQTTCYGATGNVVPCAGTGQDGDLQFGWERSFTDNLDGTVTDDGTGLMWEKLDDSNLPGSAGIHDKDNAYLWLDAFQKVTDLNTLGFAGHSDWRVPNVVELATLVNFSAASPAVHAPFQSGCVPGCTATTCSCTQSDRYWSSTSYNNLLSAAWYVDFSDGNSGGVTKIAARFVRAVRGGY